MVNSWQIGSLPSRRLYSRVETSENVWVYWRCDGRADVSSVHDMGMGGLFLKTTQVKPVGSLVNLHFLIQEGQLRADAVVRYAKTGGLGLKFAAISQEDRPKLAALMTRLRGLSRSQHAKLSRASAASA
ncbi:MAG TPA: PilZ domain-containing protein [Candidatus Acidoferrum sp.]